MSATPPVRIGVMAATMMFARAGIVVSDDTVRRMALRGELDAVRVGRQIMIAPASVENAATKPPQIPQKPH